MISSCIHQDADRSAYQVDLERFRGSAKTSLAGNEEEFRNKAQSERDSLNHIKQSLYGLNRIQLECYKKEMNYIGAFLYGPIDAADGNINLDNYMYCSQYGFSNLIRLSWSCPSEETSFIKTKTLNILKESSGIILLLDDEGVVLQKILIFVDQNSESMYSVADKVYEKVKRLRVELNNDFILIERNDWSRTIVLTDKMCQTD